MVCTLCKAKYSMDKELPFCEDCWSVLESGGIPPVNFRDFFSEGLEEKMMSVDSLLFNSPDHFFLWYLKGHLEHELGSTKRAMRSINTALSYKDDFGDAWIRLGLIYSDLHREAEAIEHFEKGLKYPLIDPTNLVDAGVSLLAAGNPDLASKVLLRALDLVPDDDKTLLTLGKVQVQLGRIDEARNTFGKGLDRYPHSDEMLRAMAQLEIKDGNIEIATEMYERILDQHPKDFEALLAMGEILLKRGDMGQSIKYYKAVKELDLHISWTGVFRFLINHLKNILNDNRSLPTYRDSLLKEFENTQSFMRDLEHKVESDPGPELLDDVERMVRLFENQKNNLKESLKQAKDLVAHTKIEDSFHKHLSSKVGSLEACLEEQRYFDAKEIMLELNPFVSELKEVDPQKEEAFKLDIIHKVKEMEEFGFEGSDVLAKMATVDAMEKEGQIESAMFLLKEMDISLMEHWSEIGPVYHRRKMEEFTRIIEESKGKFDIAPLSRKLEVLSRLSKGTPKELMDAYNDLVRTYEKESSNYFHKEADRILQEIKYKLVILEKDGGRVTELMARLSDMKERRAKMNAFTYFNEASRFLEELDRIEGDHNVEMVKKRLGEMDRLMVSLSVLGLSDEINPHIEPVRKVISKSIEAGNIRLADIMSNELFTNVDRLLCNNYIEHIRERSVELVKKISRLKEMGIEKAMMIQVSSRLKGSIQDPSEGQMIEILHSMADLATDISEFERNDLPGFVGDSLQRCRDLLEEGRSYGIELSEEITTLERMSRSAKGNSTIGMMEDVDGFMKEIETLIAAGLKRKVEKQNAELKKITNDLSSRGAEPRSVMDAMTLINRSEVLIENGKVREAFEMTKQAKVNMDKVGMSTSRSNLDRKMKTIRQMIECGMDMGIDLKGLDTEMERMPRIDIESVETLKEPVESLMERVRFLIFDGAEGLLREVERTYRSMIKSRPDSVPAEMRERFSDVQKKIKDAINRRDFEVLYPLFSRSTEIINDIRGRLRSRELVERCSVLLELGFGLKDENSARIMSKAQELTSRIQADDLEGVEEELEEIEAESRSLFAVLKMSKIEDLLRQIGEIDDLALEVFTYVKGPPFEDKERMLTDEISDLMDITSSVYETSDIDNVDALLTRVGHIRSSIMDLDSEWRAGKKMDALKGLDTKLKGPLLKDLAKVREAYVSRDWTTFFSQFDRFQERLVESEKVPVPVVEPLPEVPVPRPRTGPRLPRGAMGGIGRIASEAFSKRMKMESAPSENNGRAVAAPVETTTPLVQGDERNLAGIAKLIAGNRIDALKKVDSDAVDPSFMDDVLDSPGGERTRQVTDLMGDFIELDTSTRTSSTKEDIERIKGRLETLFNRMPSLAQLGEPREHYRQGCSHLEAGKSSRALREFRTAITSAVKVCKLHADIGKALNKVKVKLDKEKDRGADVSDLYVLMGKATILYRSGNLEESPKVIRDIAERLKRL